MSTPTPDGGPENLRRYSDATPGDTSSRPATRNGRTLAQWLAALSDHLPAAYMREFGAHLESLWSDGATVGEACAYARAYLLAPTVCPVGWEQVRAMSREQADAIAPDGMPRSLLDDLRLDGEL